MARHTELILGNGVFYSAGRKVRKKSGRKFSVLVLEVAIFSGHFSNLFLGAFTKLRKGTINSVMSVRLSAWNNFDLIGRNFEEILYLYYFMKMYQENSVLIKI